MISLPLWVVVTKDGLQTRIEFHGEWVFTNHLPQEVQVRATGNGWGCLRDAVVASVFIGCVVSWPLEATTSKQLRFLL